jgi:hypothetical protein
VLAYQYGMTKRFEARHLPPDTRAKLMIVGLLIVASLVGIAFASADSTKLRGSIDSSHNTGLVP